MCSPGRSLARLATPLVCALLLGATPAMASGMAPPARLAVFPVENLSGGAAPTDAVRQFLIARLVAAGGTVLTIGALDEFMNRHRVRYTGGLDDETARWLRDETGVDGVVIASIELSMQMAPPKIALVARLVSTADTPTVVWADDVALAGDEAPGWFDLGLENEYGRLQARALDRIASSLVSYVSAGGSASGRGVASKFAPKTSYRHVTFERGRSYTVAVVPFLDLSGRRNAGDVLALLCMRHLSRHPQFRVVDSGVVRRQLLDARIIMDTGLSLADADTVAALIDADYVLGGRVLRYEDREGAGVRARVEFSTVLIERRSRRVVWSSESANDGGDGVRLFDRGIVRTAHALATQMVGIVADMLAGERQ